MTRSSLFGLLAVLIMVADTGLANYPERARIQGPVILTGFEESSNSTPPERAPRSNLDCPQGVQAACDTLGTTWYDLQSNGTLGKQLAVDELGFVHAVWTKGLNSGSSVRHVNYNVYNPNDGAWVFPGGTQIDASQRAGFATLCVLSDGWAFPAFHQITQVDPHTCAAIDYYPASGFFQAFDVMPYVAGDPVPQVIWPKVAADIDGNIHTVSTEFGGASLDYYAKGEPWYYPEDGSGGGIEWGDGFVEWDPATFITLDVACGFHSPRVAVAWLDNPGEAGDNEINPTNVMLKISEDGGNNWGDPINVSLHPVLDTTCVTSGGDPTICNGDTMKPWIDLSIIMDYQDNVHIAWTAHGSFYWDTTGAVIDAGYVFSTLWHWDEVYEEFNLIHDAWYSHTAVALGVNNLMVHRPSLAVDTTNGNLYCSFQKFDSVQVSELGYPQGDAWISVSTNAGRTWSAGTNVSNTDGGVDAPAGQCLSERDISLAALVTNETVHMEYTLDLDAGTAVTTTPEGLPTNNPVFYVAIPTSEIPAEPFTDYLRPYHADSTGFPWDLLDATGPRSGELPSQFTLYQNYPNPFNPTTNIQFDLSEESLVNLTVFDLSGRTVRAVIESEKISAGAHVVKFDAGGLSSGVYFYRLDSGHSMQTRKMVLMK